MNTITAVYDDINELAGRVQSGSSFGAGKISINQDEIEEHSS